MNKKKINSIVFVSTIAVLAFIGIFVVRNYNPEEESFFMPCIFNKVTGLKCAGCGMTRAMHHLFNGRIGKAIWYNLMIIPSVLVLLYSAYRYIIYIIKDEPIINKTLDYVLKAFLVVIIVFMITRNFTTLFF